MPRIMAFTITQRYGKLFIGGMKLQIILFVKGRLNKINNPTVTANGLTSRINFSFLDNGSEVYCNELRTITSSTDNGLVSLGRVSNKSNDILFTHVFF